MSAEFDSSRRRFLRRATSVVGGVGGIFVATPFLQSWFPSAKAEALGAPVEVNIAGLAPGGQMTVEYRGKPIWIVRRDQSMLDSLTKLESKLRDPESNDPQQPDYAKNPHRSIKEEYLVVVGLCTHLGCVPTYRPDVGGVSKDWLGGFYCPCHGSYYDIAGRVFKGVPAPTNLPVPPHKYVQDDVILIGEDAEA